MSPLFEPETEKSILAAVLSGEAAQIPPSLDALDFTEGHSVIFRAAKELTRNGQEANLITITNQLREIGQLDHVGGSAYLTGLTTAAFSKSILKYSCERVAYLSRQRQILNFLGEVNRMREAGDVDGAVQILKKQLPVVAEMREGGCLEPKIKFFSPGELRDFQPDAGAVLVGENHILRGEIFVIGGEPGVGKSTAATELAICGATGRDWLGLKVHTRFKTLIVQNENGRFRLMSEYRARTITPEIEASIRVSEPPPYGMALDHPDFLWDVQKALETFQPEMVIFDPWNAAAKDDKAKDYSSAFSALRSMLPMGDKRPALGIIAHTRKPSMGEQRIGGSGLMHALSGSYVLSSIPRSIFVMVRGQALDEADDSVVWFNPKNSNGPCVSRSAWRRGPEGFTPLTDFDWSAFEGDGAGRRVVELADIKSVLGAGKIKRNEAVKRLVATTGLGVRACQKALSETGSFAEHLNFGRGLVEYVS